MNIFISLSVIFWSLFPSLISYTQGNELPEKIKLTNLVSNGDLLIAKASPNENQPLGFTYFSATNITLSDGIATFTANAQFGRISSISSTNYLSNKLYLFSRFKSNSANVNLTFGQGITVFHLGDNNYHLVSMVNDISVSSRFLQVSDYRTSAWTPIEIDYIGAINLTAIFGVGNEPTKLYMDNLINEIGYFEGDYYYSSSLVDNYKWFSTGFVDKTGERDFLDYLGFFVWLLVPPISIYLLYKLMKGVIYE